MAFFLLKLIPPRPNFPADITPAEAALMQEHVAYWSGLADQGTAVVFGPVADPKGTWGVGIVEVADGSAAAAITMDDPVTRPEFGFAYEVSPMPQALLRPSPAHGT